MGEHAAPLTMGPRQLGFGARETGKRHYSCGGEEKSRDFSALGEGVWDQVKRSPGSQADGSYRAGGSLWSDAGLTRCQQCLGAGVGSL